MVSKHVIIQELLEYYNLYFPKKKLTLLFYSYLIPYPFLFYYWRSKRRWRCSL